MALFNRKKQDSVLPEEVQKYYKAEKRQRTGVAWLLAFVTLVLTIVLAAALFFGGRWLYRTVFDRNDTSGSSQQTEQTDDAASTSSSESEDSAADERSDADAGNTNTTPSTPSPDSGTSATPATPPQPQLIDTGPGDE